MLPIGWGYQSVSHQLSQCCTKQIADSLASVCIESGDDSDPDSRHLVLYLNGHRSSSVEIRREVFRRFHEPLSIHFVNDHDELSGNIIILWSSLSLSSFDVDLHLPYRFQESTSFRLPPESVKISASMVFDRFVILGTGDGCVWVFDCRQEHSSSRRQALSKRRLLAAEDHVIISMSYSEQLSLFVALTGSEQLLLFRFTPAQLSDFLDSDDVSAFPDPVQRLSKFSGVCCAELCGNRLILGDQDGSLSVITLTEAESILSSSEMIPISTRTETGGYQHHGPIEDIFCLPSGAGFCVRWRDRGAAVFSLLSMSCIYAVNLNEPVLDAFMNEHCFVHASSGGIQRIDFARIPSRASTTLLCRDRVLFWNKQQQTYQELKFPLQFFRSENDFIRTAAVSANSESIAIAASTGFALFRRSTCTWEFWPDQTCQFLYWISNHIIAAGSHDRLSLYIVSAKGDTPPAHVINCRFNIRSVDFDLSTGLLLISQTTGLQSLFILTIQSPERPFPLNSAVYITDQDLNQVIINSHQLTDLDLHSQSIDYRLFWSYCTSEQRQPPKKASNGSLDWIWSLIVNQSGGQAAFMNGLQFGVLELTPTGHLIAHQFLYDDQIVDQGSSVVCTDVQRFWVNRLHPGQSIPEFYIWVYSTSRTLHILLPNDSKSSLGLNGFERRLQLVQMDPGIEPVEIWPESGAIAAVRPALAGPYLNMLNLVEIKQICYVPLLVFDKILRQQHDLARAILAPFESTEYLLPSLEFLLHYSMDAESGAEDSTDYGPSSPTGIVLSFLREYDFYLQCVVRCARKTDFSHWGRLFPLAGTSMELFQECLRKADLETGSHYLMVLQRTEGSLVAHQSAIALLDALLHSGYDLDQTKLKLALQLMRFIYMSKERNTSNYDIGTELQRRASDASNSATTVERNRSGPLPERRPSTSSDHRSIVAVREPRTSWAAGIIDWFAF